MDIEERKILKELGMDFFEEEEVEKTINKGISTEELEKELGSGIEWLNNNDDLKELEEELEGEELKQQNENHGKEDLLSLGKEIEEEKGKKKGKQFIPVKRKKRKKRK